MIVPTRMTIPKPLLAAKITEHTAKKDKAIGKALSPAISAAFFIIVSVTPTLERTFPNSDPKINPEIAVDILIEPASKTSLTMVNCSTSFEMIVIPAINDIAIAIIGSAKIVGTFLVIISPTKMKNTSNIPINCTVATVFPPRFR